MSPSPLEEAATESRCPNSIPRQPQVKMMESTRTAERRELRAMYISFDDQTRPAHRLSTDPDWLGWISKTGASFKTSARSIPRSTQALERATSCPFGCLTKFLGCEICWFPAFVTDGRGREALAARLGNWQLAVSTWQLLNASQMRFLKASRRDCLLPRIASNTACRVLNAIC